MNGKKFVYQGTIFKLTQRNENEIVLELGELRATVRVDPTGAFLFGNRHGASNMRYDEPIDAVVSACVSLTELKAKDELVASRRKELDDFYRGLGKWD